MPGGVRIGQGGGDDIVPDLAADLPGHGLPLAGRRLEPEVTVGSDPLAVHQDAHTALMPFGIEVIEGHHIHTLVSEIPLRDHLELLGLLAASCHDENGQTGRAKTPETTHDWLQFFQSYGKKTRYQKVTKLTDHHLAGRAIEVQAKAATIVMQE